MDRTFTLIKKGKPVKTFKGKNPYSIAKKIAKVGIKTIDLKEKGTKNTYKYKVIKNKVKSITSIKKKQKGGGKFDKVLSNRRGKKSPIPLRPRQEQLRPIQRRSPIRPIRPQSPIDNGKFTTRQLRNRIYHCYIVPFTYVNGGLEILIAKKLCYNKKDGWIHNNPGQYVFFGGHCRNTSEQDVYESSMKEFEEESGNQMKNKRNTILKRWDDFSSLFYEVESKEEYRRFSKLQSKSPWKEIDHVKWVGVKDAFRIMNPMETRYNNKICYGNVRNFVEEYMYQFKESNMKLKEFYIEHLKRYVHKNTGKKINNKDYDDMIKDIIQKHKRSKHYKIVADFFFMFIRKKIKTDWFFDALVYLDRDILS